jgi:hypothetical protein
MQLRHTTHAPVYIRDKKSHYFVDHINFYKLQKNKIKVGNYDFAYGIFSFM